MRKLIAATLIALALPASAQDRAGAIESVISEQIEAFLADDFAEAFTFASPDIRRLFRSPDNFGRMVRQGYPMVWRPAGVEFLGLGERDGRLAQRVMVTDGAGAIHFLDYFMTRTDAGWKIDGVVIVEPPAAGV